VLLAVTLPDASPAGEPSRYTDPATGLSFILPASFHITRYADRPDLQPGIRAALPNVIVLAENRIHPGHEYVQLGSLPTISLDLLTGERAQFNQVFFREEFKTQIAGRVVYQLPAHNGPPEQQVFYFLVPLSYNRVLEIAGHRYYFGYDGMPPTRYDQIIAGVIASLASTSM
jgi:hypothetical protein